MLVPAHPLVPGARIKGGGKRRGSQQESAMPTAAELELAVSVVNANLVQLVQQQAEVKN